MKQEYDSLFSESEQQLLKAYRNHSQEEPSSDVSQLILAAAHRESLKPQKKSQPFLHQTGWLNRLRLPFAFTGAMIMTLAVAQILWPMISISDSQLEKAAIHDLEFSQTKSTNVDLADETYFDERLLKPQKLSRKSEKNAKSATLINVDDFYDMPKDLASDVHQERSNEAERERWVQRIVKLAQEGNYQSMNQELKAFVAAYPDFPIDNLIRPYIK
jgi:hypothetical protein